MLVLVNLPGFPGRWNSGDALGGSLVGFVTLFGISTRNHYEHHVRYEGETWGRKPRCVARV